MKDSDKIVAVASSSNVSTEPAPPPSLVDTIEPLTGSLSLQEALNLAQTCKACQDVSSTPQVQEELKAARDIAQKLNQLLTVLFKINFSIYIFESHKPHIDRVLKITDLDGAHSILLNPEIAKKLNPICLSFFLDFLMRTQALFPDYKPSNNPAGINLYLQFLLVLAPLSENTSTLENTDWLSLSKECTSKHIGLSRGKTIIECLVSPIKDLDTNDSLCSSDDDDLVTINPNENHRNNYVSNPNTHHLPMGIRRPDAHAFLSPATTKPTFLAPHHR